MTPRSRPLTRPLSRHLIQPVATSTIAEYYDQTDSSYEHWGNDGAYELHYGYYECEATAPGDLADGDLGAGATFRESHGRALRRMNRALADAVAVNAEDRVLDAGCGVGGSSLWLAEHRGCRVHGISLSEVQVDKARGFAAQLGEVSERLRFSIRDFTATGFRDASFDVVWALESSSHADSSRRFLEEAYRLLRPGGRLVIGDFFLTREPTSDIERYSLRRWLSGWAMPGLLTVDGVVQELETVGFQTPEAFDITDRIRPSAEEIYRRGRDGYPGDIMEKGKNVLQIQHVEACLFQKICLDQGLWRYRIQTARKPV
ncbi:MAG: methyltransferase domain-containing protein [Acidobacteriota bacterium]